MRRGLLGRGILIGIAVAVALGLLLSACAPGGEEAEPVKIGGIFPQTGPYANEGKTITEGATLAVEEINAAGGIFGLPVEKYWRDDELKVEVALRRAHELVETVGVDFFEGTIHVGIAAALNEYSADSGALYACDCTTTPEMSAKGTLSPYVLLPFPRMSQMAGVPADVFAQKMAPKTAYIIGADYAYGWVTSAVFQEVLESYGVEIIGGEPEFHPLGATDFSPYITKIQNMDPQPDVLVSCNFGTDMIQFIKQAVDFGLEQPFLCASLTEGFAKGIGPTAFRNVYGMMYYYNQVDTPESKAFVDSYTARFGYPPDSYAGDGYWVTTFLLEAVKELGTTDKDAIMDYFSGKTLTGLKGPEWVRPHTYEFVQNIVVVRGKDPAQIEGEYDLFEVIDVAGYEGGEKYLVPLAELGWE